MSAASKLSTVPYLLSFFFTYWLRWPFSSSCNKEIHQTLYKCHIQQLHTTEERLSVSKEIGHSQGPTKWRISHFSFLWSNLWKERKRRCCKNRQKQVLQASGVGGTLFTINPSCRRHKKTHTHSKMLHRHPQASFFFSHNSRFIIYFFNSATKL